MVTWTGGNLVLGKGRSVMLNSVALAAAGNAVGYGLGVTQNGGGAMSVVVAAGAFRAAGTLVKYAGATKTITAAHASLNRLDLISAKSDGTVNVTDGTAATSPQAPALPASSIPLALVYVAANAASILTANIYDVSQAFDAARVEHVAYDATPGSTSTNAYATIGSIALSAAQASYSFIDVVFMVSASGGSNANGSTFKVRSDGADVGTYGAIIVANVAVGFYCIKRRLTAGTHYTKGTGFTVDIQGIGSVGSGSTYPTESYESMDIKGTW